jgi:uncharacterized protein (DUF433 family)
MNGIFTPNEAAALIEISPKRIYKEIEHSIISFGTPDRLSFATLVYLRALKEINFNFSVSYRIQLHQALQTAWEQQLTTLEFGKFFTLKVGAIGQELQTLVDRFEAWKSRLASDPGILGGEIVFPNSRLSVQRIGGSLERGETVALLREDYPYLSDEDFNFARIYVKAYPKQGRPKIDEVYN